MFMDTNELKTTASLARLSLDDSELDKLAGMVDQILDYFAKMTEIDVDHLPPTTHALQEENVVRADLPETGNTPDLPDRLIEKAPEHEGRFITIPNVL